VTGATRRRHRQHGFSLLELLVVLFVVVIMVSLASVNTGGGGAARRLADEVQHVLAVAEYARDEAAFSGRDFGLRLARDYRDGTPVSVLRWRERREGAWRRPDGGEVFEPLVFAPELELELALEGAPVVLDQEAAEGAAPAPQVVLYASGETVPGSLSWRRADTGEFLWRLDWDLLGRFQLHDDPLAARDG
jgi:general secretion pathway protein H